MSSVSGDSSAQGKAVKVVTSAKAGREREAVSRWESGTEAIGEIRAEA